MGTESVRLALPLPLGQSPSRSPIQNSVKSKLQEQAMQRKSEVPLALLNITYLRGNFYVKNITFC
jgi:hypothetical protein